MRDRCLAGAGIAGEAHVQRRRLGRETQRLPHALDEQQRGNLADARFDRHEADQLAVELHRELRRRCVSAQLLVQVDSHRRGFRSRRFGHATTC